MQISQIIHLYHPHGSYSFSLLYFLLFLLGSQLHSHNQDSVLFDCRLSWYYLAIFHSHPICSPNHHVVNLTGILSTTVCYSMFFHFLVPGVNNNQIQSLRQFQNSFSLLVSFTKTLSSMYLIISVSF